MHTKRFYFKVFSEIYVDESGRWETILVADQSANYKIFNASVKKSMLTCCAIDKTELSKRSVKFNSNKRWVQSVRLPPNTDPKSIVVKVQGSNGL